MEEAKKKRLLIDVSPEFHAQIKVMASRRGISVRRWVTRVLFCEIKREEINEKSV